jgi:hypothetical protein
MRFEEFVKARKTDDDANLQRHVLERARKFEQGKFVEPSSI